MNPNCRDPNSSFALFAARADAESRDRIYLVKRVPVLRATRQIRILAAKAAILRKTLVLVIPAGCRLEAPLEELARSRAGVIQRETLP